MRKRMRFLAGALILILLTGLMPITAFAATAPALTSATYNVGTGDLVLTGTDLVSVKGNKKRYHSEKKSVLQTA